MRNYLEKHEIRSKNYTDSKLDEMNPERGGKHLIKRQA